ncbi:ribonuclease H-like protein [Phellopilus nigrolimitatus]|nr:ribonuclease H-like protein [Phellopilus nigrolimitatus]
MSSASTTNLTPTTFSSPGARSSRTRWSADAHPSSQVLDAGSGPLVWIDLEMTGLNPKVDKIMEIAVLITDGSLGLVDDGIQFVIKVNEEELDRTGRTSTLRRMDDWCTTQHGSSGLTQACLSSPHTLFSVESAVLNYIKQHIPEKMTGVLAGNSVHVDKTFLAEYMPSLVEHLHYRIVDVSSIKELCRRWYPEKMAPRTVAENVAHRALDDIHGSIRELQWYRENIFVRPKADAPSSTSSDTKK